MSDEINWDDFSERDLHRKLGLQVENRIFWVSREALADFGSVFKTMFYGQYEESNKEIVSFPTKKADEILEMLRCLFRSQSKVKAIDTQNVEILMQLADEYEIEYLTKRCEKFLKKEMTVVGRSGDRIVELFLLGVRYRLKQIVRDLFPDIRRYNCKELKPYFQELPSEIRNALLTPTCLPTTQTKHDMREVATSVDCQACVNRKNQYIVRATNQCSSCNWATCKMHCHLDSSDLCGGCQICENRNPRNGAKEKTCQCIGKLAIGELEKGGF